MVRRVRVETRSRESPKAAALFANSAIPATEAAPVRVPISGTSRDSALEASPTVRVIVRNSSAFFSRPTGSMNFWTERDIRSIGSRISRMRRLIRSIGAVASSMTVKVTL